MARVQENDKQTSMGFLAQSEIQESRNVTCAELEQRVDVEDGIPAMLNYKDIEKIMAGGKTRCEGTSKHWGIRAERASDQR